MLHYAVAAVAVPLLLAVSVRGQGACTNACTFTDDSGNTYDFTSLQGQNIQTTDAQGNTYYMNMCGTSTTSCPDDPSIPPVTSGMIVQTPSGGASCFVLGVSVLRLLVFWFRTGNLFDATSAWHYLTATLP